MISVTAKYKQGNTITFWNSGIHTSAGLIADLLGGHLEIIEIVINPDNDPDLPGLKERQQPPVEKQ